jgi:hypothetical protein
MLRYQATAALCFIGGARPLMELYEPPGSGFHFGVAISSSSSAIIACIHSLAIWNNC